MHVYFPSVPYCSKILTQSHLIACDACPMPFYDVPPSQLAVVGWTSGSKFDTSAGEGPMINA